MGTASTISKCAHSVNWNWSHRTRANPDAITQTISVQDGCSHFALLQTNTVIPKLQNAPTKKTRLFIQSSLTAWYVNASTIVATLQISHDQRFGEIISFVWSRKYRT